MATTKVGWEAVRLPAAWAVRTLLRVSVLPVMPVMVVPAGMPVATVSKPEEAAVRAADNVTTLPAMFWIVVPAGMPRPVTVWPTARLVVLPTVTVAGRIPAAVELLIGLTMAMVPIAWPALRPVTSARVTVLPKAAPVPSGRMMNAPEATGASGSMPVTGEPALSPATLVRLRVLVPATPQGKVMSASTVGVVWR